MIGNAERKIQSAFQSTLPARGATTFPQSPRTSTINFNPRSPHGERLTRVQSAARADNFNPRSPHGERRWLMCETGRFTDFNPRSPHGERLAPTEMITQRGVFQSTLPARGATYVGNHSAAYSAFQSTLPARGATLRWTVKNTRLENFNPRSPHGERHNALHTDSAEYNFNPRSPHGERRMGRRYVRLWQDFNPRSPHGERRVSMHTSRRRRKFQSTLPARGATRRCSCCGRMALFQSTLPARGATRLVRNDASGANDFNPRSPHGERRNPVHYAAGQN